MCKDCFEKVYYGFPSQLEFKNFEDILDSKTRSNKIKILESNDENKLMDYRMYFLYNTCEEIFVLSIPDHAWRGYFLTQENASAYHDKLYSSDKSKKYSCLVMIIILCSLLIYALFANV